MLCYYENVRPICALLGRVQTNEDAIPKNIFWIFRSGEAGSLGRAALSRVQRATVASCFAGESASKTPPMTPKSTTSVKSR